MSRWTFAVVVVVVGALAACLPDQGDVCCSCVIDNDCWDTSLCPDDPSGSCRYTIGSGDLPAYAGGDVNAVCFAVLTDCANQSCSSECAGEVAGVE